MSDKNEIDYDTLFDEIQAEEGLVLHAYEDHLGYLTIGIGRLIDKRKGGGISQDEADYLLANDVEKIRRELNRRIPWWTLLDGVRRRVLIAMAFQLGVDGLLAFKNMLSALERGDYQAAGEHGRDSLWWKEQTPERAERMIRRLETGEA